MIELFSTIFVVLYGAGVLVFAALAPSVTLEDDQIRMSYESVPALHLLLMSIAIFAWPAVLFFGLMTEKTK